MFKKQLDARYGTLQGKKGIDQSLLHTTGELWERF